MNERKRRAPLAGDEREPTFDEYMTARRVMIYTRRWLERNGERVTLSEDPIFSHVVLMSSSLNNPALFEASELASAEGRYDRSAPEWNQGQK